MPMENEIFGEYYSGQEKNGDTRRNDRIRYLCDEITTIHFEGYFPEKSSAVDSFLYFFS